MKDNVDLQYHYALFKLKPGATLNQITRVYQRLIKRCNPDRFLTDSPEQETAAQVYERIRTSYEALYNSLTLVRSSQSSTLPDQLLRVVSNDQISE